MLAVSLSNRLLLFISVLCLLFEALAKGLFVVPGLGRADRLNTVVSNLLFLEKYFQSGEWDCRVYIYAVKSDESFWSNQDQLTYIKSLCKTVENPNGKVTENLFLLNPASINGTYNKVFIVLDDCKLSGVSSFDLAGVVRTMEYNNLTVISPQIVGANVGGGQKFRNIMQTNAAPGTTGYVSSFVEIFVWVMTMPAYQALWELFCPAVNPYAWGYDFWYDGYARGRVPGHKMGIMSTVRVLHEQDTSESGAGRTDTTPFKVKWAAVQAQEVHYMKHLKVDLRYYRTHLDLANHSWNGAVKGYLSAPPASALMDSLVDVVTQFDARKEVGQSSAGLLKAAGRKRPRKTKRQSKFSANEVTDIET